MGVFLPLFAETLNIPSEFNRMATRGRPENGRGSFHSSKLLSPALLSSSPLFPIVLLITAQSLVLLKDYVKILNQVADPHPETGNP